MSTIYNLDHRSLAIWNDLMRDNGVAAGDPFGFSFDTLNIDKDDPRGIPASAADPVIRGPFGRVAGSSIRGGTTATIDPRANPSVRGLPYRTGASTGGTTGVFFLTSAFGKGRVAARGDSSPVDDGTGAPHDQLFDGWNDASGSDAILALNATEWLAQGGAAGPTATPSAAATAATAPTAAPVGAVPATPAAPRCYTSGRIDPAFDDGEFCMRTIDLRSDTVTLPTPEMRRAIAEAPLGDDVYGEDPTINALEALAAERVGKQAAVLVVSGTMGNLCAILAHCARGEEAIVGDESHIYHYEAGGPAALGGVAFHVVPTAPTGELPLAALAGAVRDVEDPHEAITRLICLENTHNRCGGVVLAPAYMQSVGALARERGLKIHLDGARLFNAVVALNMDAREITRHVDSVQFCLSKGLSAPVGSILAGDAALIARARRVRKLVGGGMRQAGIIAAAGIVALEQMVDRLAEDHANARTLAEGLATFPQIEIDLATVQSDIVIFKLREGYGTAEAFARALAERGVLVGGIGYGRLRAVTHYGLDAGDVEEALEIVRAALAEI